MYLIKQFEDQIEITTPQETWIRVREMPDCDPEIAFDNKGEYISNQSLNAIFRNEIADLRMFVVRFNDLEITRGLLQHLMSEIINDRDIAWLDTDYGWVISARDFLARIAQDPNWDWRQVPGGDQE